MAKRRTGDDKYERDMRIKGATPEALAKRIFGGAKPRPETRPKARQAKP